MFFNKTNLIDTQLFEGFTDHHSHILPCVDDGVRSIDEAVEILDWYGELGLRKVIFTPHIMEDFPRNNATSLRCAFDKFKGSYGGNIELQLGAEYMLDSKFDSHLQSGDMLTLHANYLLVECSYAEIPICFWQRVQATIQRGYFVVLAHPERYLYLRSDDYRRLKDMGVLFQLNILSALGGYGTKVAQRAKELLDLSLYDLVGTDIHNIHHHKNYICKQRLSKSVAKQIAAISSSTLHI